MRITGKVQPERSYNLCVFEASFFDFKQRRTNHQNPMINKADSPVNDLKVRTTRLVRLGKWQ